MCSTLRVQLVAVKGFQETKAKISNHETFSQQKSNKQYLALYILVKAVLYDKIQHEGWGRVANTAQGEAECCISHETPPRVLYFIVQHEYTVLLLIFWFCVGGLITVNS